MPALDPSARAAVGQFAQSMGLTARENDDGSFGFDFADTGRLSITPAQVGDVVLVSLRRRLVLDDLVPLARLAAAGGPDPLEGFVFQPGLTKADQAVLTVAIARCDFDLPRLDAAFLALGRAFAGQGLQARDGRGVSYDPPPPCAAWQDDTTAAPGRTRTEAAMQMDELKKALSGPQAEEILLQVGRYLDVFLKQPGIKDNAIVQGLMAGNTPAQTLGLSRDDLEALYSVGFTALASGEMQRAEDVFTRLILLDPLEA
jgi:hypothetical protein